MVASRRRVLFVHGERGRTSLSVTLRTGRKRRFPRRQAFAIWAPHAAGALPMAKPWPLHTKSPHPYTSSRTIASRGLSTRRFRAHSAVRLINTNNSGKRKTSSPLRDVVAINGPPFRNEAALCATLCECSSGTKVLSPCANSSIRSRHRRPRTEREERVFSFPSGSSLVSGSWITLAHKSRLFPPGKHDVRKNNGRCLFT
jgi:hypothetical protein